jgi:hypothetical protein
MRYLSLLALSFIVHTSGLVAMPSQVILLRHAEKPLHGDTLSEQGFARSSALVTYFSQPTMPFQLQTPVAIYAQRSDKNHSSTRPVQTIAPLASYWQVPLYTKYSAEKCQKLVNEISENYNSGLVVVCWSHDNLKTIATKFGVSCVPDWPEYAYDWVWVITFDGEKVSSFQGFLQNLL